MSELMGSPCLVPLRMENMRHYTLYRITISWCVVVDCVRRWGGEGGVPPLVLKPRDFALHALDVLQQGVA